MSSKWNERLVTNFLKAYKEHPCLWNPYHKDYYNCYEKNVALQKIMDHFDAPGFTVTDYLHQIKNIREKYKKEQTRTIKSLQTQKPYKSPFPWYNIVADMLSKVIEDEERAKQQNSFSTLRSLSSDNIKNSQWKEKLRAEAKLSKIRPCNTATCDRISRRSKSVEKASRLIGKPSSPEKAIAKEKGDKKVRYPPSLENKKRRDRSRDREDMILNCKPTRDPGFETNDYPVTSTVPRVSIESRCNCLSSSTRRYGKAYEPPFLKCPLCGWENAEYEETEKSVESNFVSCSVYSKNLTGTLYTSCVGCDGITRDGTTRDDLPHESEYIKKYVDNSGDFDILQDLTKQLASTNLTKKQPKVVPEKSSVESTDTIKTYTDVEVQYVEEPEEVSRDKVAVRIPLQAEVIQDEPLIDNQLKYGTIAASTQLKIILSNLNKNLTPDAEAGENVCHSTQCVQCAKTESFAKGTQFSADDVSPRCVKINRGVNTVSLVKNQIENTVDISGGSKKCVSIQTVRQTAEKGTGRDERSSAGSIESKEVMVNIVDQESKEIQSTVCVSRGDFASLVSSRKMIEAGTAMSTHQVRCVGCMTMENVKEFKSKCTQCDPNVDFVLINKEEYHSTVEKEIQDFDRPCTRDTCPLNILNLIQENPSVAGVLQQLLRNILFKDDRSMQSTQSARQTDHQDKCESKRGCVIDASEMVNVIKQHATKTLGLNVTENNVEESRENMDNELFSQFVQAKPNFVDTDSAITYDSKLCMTEENVLRPILRSALAKGNKRERIIEDETPHMENACKRFPAEDKVVCACSSYKEINIKGPVMQLSIRDANTQYSMESTKDSVSLATYENDVPEMISIGIQKRDPIVVRLIKCTGSQAVVRTDKETFTIGSDTNHEKKYTSKRVETCGRPTCIAPAISEKLNETNIQLNLRKECEGKMVSKHCRRCVTFKDDICDNSCSGKLSYDWTDVTNIDILSNVANSKIPLCVKPRKYAYCRK